MALRYRVRCGPHGYDTSYNIDSRAGAISAARMHAMLPCDKVEVMDQKGNLVEWREDEKDNERKINNRR